MSHLSHLSHLIPNYARAYKYVASRYFRGKSAVTDVTAVTRIGVNDAGRRVGESHQNAKLTDDDVRHMLELHNYHGLGYKKLAGKFECSRRLVQLICQGKRRAQAPTKFKPGAT